MEVGDEVRYVPDRCHALHKDHATGDYPWVIGVRTVRQVPSASGPPEAREEVVELHGRDLEERLAFVRRAPDPREAAQALVLVRPNAAWPGVVTAVHDDGTVDLDVRSHRGGVTLHCPRVPVDRARKLAHSCHAEGGAR